MNMAETMSPKVNLGAGKVLADALFPQKAAQNSVCKIDVEKEAAYETALKKEISNKWKRTLTAWLLLAPSLVFLCVFTIYPIVKSVISSFYLDNLSVMQPVFAGLSNYIALFQDKVYWECFWNNLLIAVVTVPISIGLDLHTQRLFRWWQQQISGCLYTRRYTVFWVILIPTGDSWRTVRRRSGLSW